MPWKRTFWIIANLDSEFPGWREKFRCVEDHPLFDIYQELIEANNNLKTPVKDDYLGRSFYIDRPINADGVRFLCGLHWIEKNPSAFLLSYAGMVSRSRTNKERREIVKKAFAYANRHGYDAALRYLDRFETREVV